MCGIHTCVNRTAKPLRKSQNIRVESGARFLAGNRVAMMSWGRDGGLRNSDLGDRDAWCDPDGSAPGCFIDRVAGRAGGVVGRHSAAAKEVPAPASTRLAGWRRASIRQRNEDVLEGIL